MTYPEDFDDIIILDAAHFESLTKPVQVATLLHALEAEVNNGGFHQFLTNSSGYFALQTIDALRAIGAGKTKALLESALRLAYPGGYPNDAADHEDVPDDDSLLEAMGELDDSFYRYDDSLTDLVNKYLASDQT